ncbi:diaminopimelate epimerase [Clostridium moniliforme]|uniref:Diaminopimelate epimerase n=1 Tax=Clostridium moniliforme TaxID=39489 RepID=A0ABS4F0G1_9CLOT|nr:diaminopimelate epimerase [Clostridium moniliforme]MBP1889737.1 diaminopimelate epimerase [Clostridium moniliforme]
MKFTKMQGIGNDFIFIEDLDNTLESSEIDIAKKLCNRHFGIGADGLIIIRNSHKCDMKMTIINSDGSRANMCGNAIRCFGRYIYDKGYVKDKCFSVETGDGKKEITLIEENGKFVGAKVYMGKPSFEGDKIPLKNKKELINETININNKNYNLTSVLVGVPHTIIIEDKDGYNVEEGKFIEKFEIFKEGTNVNFVKVISKDHIKVETWERGAGATLACGTGTCASAVVAHKFGLINKKVLATLKGGELIIEVEDDGVYMTGNAEYICTGETI